MDKIIKKNGYVYLVEGNIKGFEKLVLMGKDIDDPMWKEEAQELKQVLQVEIPNRDKKKIRARK